MKPVALFYMRPDFGGGSTSFAVHLCRGLDLAGYAPSIYRVRARGEEYGRPFSRYDGINYRNVTLDEALRIVKSGPSLLTAPIHSKYLPFAPDAISRLASAGMRVVIHDPNEFKVYDHLRGKVPRPICIRPTMKKFFPDAVFIPHPYVREFANSETTSLADRELNAVSVARVTFVKRSDVILEANKLLPKEQRCILRGAMNRMYVHHKLRRTTAEMRGAGFPLTWGASARECRRARLAVDLTYFPDDGGGSQYSFLEAWDAGAVCVLHQDWLRYPGEMTGWENCVPVKDAADLARVLSRGQIGARQMQKYAESGYESLRRHDAAEVAKEYYRELTR